MPLQLYISNPTASVMCHAENADVTSICCEAPCLFHALIIMLPVYRSCKCLLTLIHIFQWGHIYHTDLAKNVARCRDSEVRIQRALKMANVDLGCLNVMASPSLFLHFFRQLVFPCSYLIRGTIPTSVLVLVENIFTPLYDNITTYFH